MKNYPVFVTLDWLNNNINNKNLVIIDARSKKLYNINHIINAQHMGIEDVIKINQHGAHLVLDESELNVLFGSIGINSAKTVIIYGNYNDHSMFRIAWTLLYSGHTKVDILDIGITMNDLYSSNSKPDVTQTSYVSNIDNSSRITTKELNEQIGNVTILDARSPQEYMYGHIPTAISSPFFYGLKSNSFQSSMNLKTMFKEKIIGLDDDIVCYCSHGHRASNLFFQLLHAGYKNVKLYDGSFTDWYGKHFEIE